MKKAFASLLLSATLLAASCSSTTGTADSAKPDSATADTATPAAPATEESSTAIPLTLTGAGIGPVKIGVNALHLPDKIGGIYDNAIIEKTYNDVEQDWEVTGDFFQNGELMFSIIGEENGDIACVLTSNPKVKVQVGSRAYSVGTPIADLLKAGAKEDPSGAWDAIIGDDIYVTATPEATVYTLQAGSW